jgi:hypothetical protein
MIYESYDGIDSSSAIHGVVGTKINPTSNIGPLAGLACPEQAGWVVGYVYACVTKGLPPHGEPKGEKRGKKKERQDRKKGRNRRTS